MILTFDFHGIVLKYGMNSFLNGFFIFICIKPNVFKKGIFLHVILKRVQKSLKHILLTVALRAEKLNMSSEKVLFEKFWSCHCCEWLSKLFAMSTTITKTVQRQEKEIYIKGMYFF